MVNHSNFAQSSFTFLEHETVQRISGLVLNWTQDNSDVLFIILALVFGYTVGCSRASRKFRALAFQNRGESLVSQALLTNFRPPDYHLMNHITLRTRDGTTQIDHILVSGFGVFVIETKDYKGWIFANAKYSYRTQALSHGRFDFRNPIHQNFRHLRAVEELLDFLLPGVIKTVVIFTSRA